LFLKAFELSLEHCIFGIFVIHERKVNKELFIRCLNVMQKRLKRDIYNLEDPGLLIEELPSLNPDPLALIGYACVYWIDHLCEIKSGYDEVGLCDGGEVHVFLQKHFSSLAGGSQPNEKNVKCSGYD
jgi:hypothetical protein